MSCRCDWHVRWFYPFQEHIKSVSDESSRVFFEAMFDELCMEQEERSIAEAIIDGKWPTADEVIEKRRRKVENARVPD